MVFPEDNNLDDVVWDKFGDERNWDWVFLPLAENIGWDESDVSED